MRDQQEQVDEQEQYNAEDQHYPDAWPGELGTPGTKGSERLTSADTGSDSPDFTTGEEKSERKADKTSGNTGGGTGGKGPDQGASATGGSGTGGDSR